MSIILVDSYSESNSDGNLYIRSGLPARAQSFMGTARVLNSAVWYLKKFGLPTGNAVAKIYAHSGTYGTSSIPTGVALATSDVFDIATLLETYQLIIFTFSGINKIILIDGTYYCVTIEYEGGDGENYIHCGRDSSTPSHSGNSAYYIPTTWSPYAGTDLCFYVYGATLGSMAIALL